VAADATGLVGYWRFGETEGTAVADSSKNGLDGTLNVLPGGSITLSSQSHISGKQLILPFGTGQYEIRFSGTLGQTLQVDGDEAEQTLSAVELSGQPVVIGIGDINNDGYEDAIVSVRDLVPDGQGGFRNFARVAFGSANGLDASPDLDGDPTTQD